MIIEGKHAEVGQGIFVSDIQEGSAADKVICLIAYVVCIFLRFKLCFFARLALKLGK